jgi:hypothetical protein
MKYRLTVWNTIIVLLIPYIGYVLITEDASPTDIVGAAYMIPIVILGAVIDFIFQVGIKNRIVLAIVEIVSLVAIVIINNLP